MPRPHELRALRGGPLPFVALAAAHVLVGGLAQRWPHVALAHAFATTLLVPVAFLVRRPHAVALVLVYIAGSEVFWRMVAGPLVPWEWAKYLGVAGSVGLAVFGRRSSDAHVPRWVPVCAAAYLVLLLPSMLVPIADPHAPADAIGKAARFYLLNPIVLACMTFVMSASTFRARDWHTVLATMLCAHLPIVGVMGVTLLRLRTLTGDAIATLFPDDSTALLTGGFGPNQVSGALGVAAIAGVLLAIDRRVRPLARAAAVAGAVATLVAAALTFSRGGLYGAVLALGPSLVIAARDARLRRPLLLVLGVLTAGGLWIVVPHLDSLTGGALTTRFADTQPTGRDLLILDDLRMLGENPLLGVGPGQSSHHRTLLEYGMGHTEYTRMFAEHGTLGVAATVCLLALYARVFRRAGTRWERVVRVALASWAMVTMLHLAMRIADVAVVFAIAQAGVTRARASRAGRIVVHAPTAARRATGRIAA